MKWQRLGCTDEMSSDVAIQLAITWAEGKKEQRDGRFWRPGK
jgi:hypothetical protein